MTDIDDRHAYLSSMLIDMGEPTSEETPVGDGGAYRVYQNGVIYWHPETGAWESWGLIGEAYAQQWGGPEGPLGFPTSGEFAAGESRLVTFERGDCGLFYTQAFGVELLADYGLHDFESLLTPHLPKLPAATQKICFPPSAVMTPLRAAGFGLIAERLIHDDYCNQFGCDPAHDYFDRTGSPHDYLVFLQSHNPGLGIPHYRQVRRWNRPDILTDNPPRREWYEIKPFSIHGVIAFGLKYDNITGYMAKFGLPYVPGTTYTPTSFIPLGTFPVLGVPITAQLGVSRRIPGLVDYVLCLDGNLAQVLANIALAALVAAIIVQILSKFAILAAA